jgi:hypothetical protein
MPFALRKPEAADVSDGSKGVLPNPSCHLRNLVRSPIDSCRGAVDQPPLTLCATSGLMHRTKWRVYSITSSAMASSVSGTSRPSGPGVR